MPGEGCYYYGCRISEDSSVLPHPRPKSAIRAFKDVTEIRVVAHSPSPDLRTRFVGCRFTVAYTTPGWSEH